ncbi:MAG: hypothetical protein ACLVLH_20040 [Eisenbergiella massiliensis]
MKGLSGCRGLCGGTLQKGIASVGGYMYDRAEEMGQLKAVLEETRN